MKSSTQHQVATLAQPTPQGSGQNVFWGADFAPENSSTRDHSGVAGGFTWCVGEKLEVVSPQQFSRAGRETLTSSTQRQVATLGLEPPSGQNVFLGADLSK